MTITIDSFKILEKVIRISNSTVDIKLRIKNLLQLFIRDLGFDLAVLYYLDRDAGKLYPKASAEEHALPTLCLGLDDNFVGRAVRSRKPVYPRGSALRETAGTAWPLVQGFEEFASFPIMDDQVLYGVLTLAFRKKTEVFPDWIALIETIAREMAGTIRNYRLYAESKRRVGELSVLYETGKAVSSTLQLEEVLKTVVNITCKILQAEGCNLNVQDMSTGMLRVAAEYGIIPRGCSFVQLLGQPLSKEKSELISCLDRSEPYIGPAADSPFFSRMNPDDAQLSVICLPINFKGDYKGNLNVFNKISAPPETEDEFNRENLELLSAMGAMISSSLENALTFQAVDGLAQHNKLLVRNLSCLYDISVAMMTTVKMDELLAIISKALTLKQGLGFDRAMILLVNEEEDALYGAALKQVSPENSSPGLPLTEMLKPDISGANKELEEINCPDIEIPLQPGQNVLADTALGKKGFIVSQKDEERGPEMSLPLGLGQYSFATVTMLAKGKVVGVIAVDRDLSRLDITNEDLQNLSMLANQAGLAIENSRLYEYIEHMNLSLSQTRERLLEAEKLAALGEMAAGMAHEIRNPLVSIGGFTRRLLKSMDHDSPHRVYIEVIINEVTRLEKTLSEVLDFSRDTLGHLEEHNLNDVLNEALYILRRDLKEERIKIIKDFNEIPTVLIDERQIKHVFFNLFFNAQQAMEKGGLLLVKTYSTTMADRVYAVCEVSDEGPGIAPEVLPNIFNPFFTTKDTGTGLGLSIVHKIISRHNGVIEVVNRPDKGATFTIKLPAAAVSGVYLK